MARPWDSTLYVESTPALLIDRPKCPEYFAPEVPVVLQGLVVAVLAAVVETATVL